MKVFNSRADTSIGAQITRRASLLAGDLIIVTNLHKRLAEDFSFSQLPAGVCGLARTSRSRRIRFSSWRRTLSCPIWHRRTRQIPRSWLHWRREPEKCPAQEPHIGGVPTLPLV